MQLIESTALYAPQVARVWAALAASTCLLGSPVHADTTNLARRYERPLERTPVAPLGSTSDSILVYGELFSASGTGTSRVSLEPAVSRETTERERLIGVLRGWEHFNANWDGEGAKAPDLTSLRCASAFACLLDRQTMPEPMLHDNGRAGLFWEADALYADLEFLENGSIAYYIERNGDRHKGVVAFNKRKLPDVFAPLLPA